MPHKKELEHVLWSFCVQLQQALSYQFRIVLITMWNTKKVYKEQNRTQFNKRVRGVNPKYSQTQEKSVPYPHNFMPQRQKPFKKQKENSERKKTDSQLAKQSKYSIKLTPNQMNILEKMKDQDDRRLLRSYFQSESISNLNSLAKSKEKTEKIKRLEEKIKKLGDQKQKLQAAYQKQIKELQLRLNQKKQASLAVSEKQEVKQLDSSMALIKFEQRSLLDITGSQNWIVQKRQTQQLNMPLSFFFDYGEQLQG